MDKKTEKFLKQLFAFLAEKIEAGDTNSVEVLTVMAYLQDCKDSKEIVSRLKELEKRYEFLTEISLQGEFSDLSTEMK